MEDDILIVEDSHNLRMSVTMEELTIWFARDLVDRLHEVDAETLAALKRNLESYNVDTGEWI